VGRNQWNEAGDSTGTTPRKLPVQTGTLSTMTAVDAGAFNGFAWDSSGAVKGWGWNFEGELGDGTTTNRSSPVSSLLTSVVALHGGYEHTVAAKSERIGLDDRTE